MNALAVLPMLLYLVLHRSRPFGGPWADGGLDRRDFAGGYLLSVLHGGPMYRTFIAPAWQQLRGGDVGALIYWFTLWLLLQAVLLSVWRLARSIAQLHMQARALSLRNSLLMDNYHALERKVRESAAVRHESAHRLAAMDAMLKEGDLEGLERCLKAWKKSDSAASPILFTKNIAVNAILQDAAGRAQSAGIDFQAEVMVPQELPYPDEDLCALLMNLLDNALEGRSARRRGRRGTSPSRCGPSTAFWWCAVTTPLTAGWKRTRGGISSPPRTRPPPTGSAWPRCAPWRRSTAAPWMWSTPATSSPCGPPCSGPGSAEPGFRPVPGGRDRALAPENRKNGRPRGFKPRGLFPSEGGYFKLFSRVASSSFSSLGSLSPNLP